MELRSGQKRLDTVFEILSHHRRRYVLRALRRYDTPVSLADLADGVAALEYGRPLTDADPGDVKRVYLSLYHTHVPKLSAAGVVAYDRERDTVTPGRRIEEFREHLPTE